MRFLHRPRDKNYTLHSKAQIVPESEAGNMSLIITGSGGALEITINEIAACVVSTWILCGYIELSEIPVAPVPGKTYGRCYRDTPFTYIDTPRSLHKHPPHIGLVPAVAVTISMSTAGKR
jgi:hypothetical protein